MDHISQGKTRNVLILAGSTKTFLFLASELKDGISNVANVTMGIEKKQFRFYQVISNRIAKKGMILGLSQLTMRFIDIYILRFRVQKNLKIPKKHTFDFTINDINSKALKDNVINNSIDIVVTIGVSIIKPETLRLAKVGYINLHPGILPEYRGLGNFWAVLNSDWSKVGITCHWIDEGIDTGQIIWKSQLLEIPNSYWEINFRSFIMGIRFLSENISNLSINKEETPLPKTKLHSWFSIKDYLKFKNILRERHRNESLTF